MDNKRRLLVASAANPSLRVAVAPPAPTPNIQLANNLVAPNISRVGTLQSNQKLIDTNGNEAKVGANFKADAGVPQQPNTSLVETALNLGKGLIKAPVQFLNTAGQDIVNLGLTAKTGIDQLRGADTATINNDFALERAGMQGYNENEGGLFNMGTLYSSEDAKKGDIATGARKIGAGTAETALSVLPFAKGLGLGVEGLNAGLEAANGGSKAIQLVKTGAKTAAEGAAYGAGFTGAEQLKNGEFNPLEIAKGAGTGALFGVAATGAGALLKGGFNAGKNALIKNAATIDIDKTTLNYLKNEKNVNAINSYISHLAGGSSDELTIAAEQIANASSTKEIAQILSEIPQSASGAAKSTATEVGNALDNNGETVMPSTTSLSKTATNSFENDASGIKPGGLERAAGQIDNATAQPIRYRITPEGKVVIEDGRHRLEAARQAGIDDFPAVDVTKEYSQPMTAEAQQALDNLKSGQPLSESDLRAVDEALGGTAPTTEPAPQSVATQTGGVDTTTGSSAPIDAITPDAPITGKNQQQAVGIASTAPKFTPDERATLIDAGVDPENVKSTGFANSVRGAEDISKETKAQLSSSYNPITNNELQDSAQQLLNSGVENAQATVAQSLSKELGSITAQDTADAIALGKYYDNLGGVANQEQAAQIFDKLAEHLTKSGQTIQAASLLDALSPEALLYRARRDLTGKGVELTPQLSEKLNGAIQAVRDTPVGTEGHTYAVQVFRKAVADEFPHTVADKAVAIWKAGLLSGVRTQTGNLLSNGTFAAMHELSNPGAVLLDKLISLKTGIRAKSLTGRGQVDGVADGFKKAYQYLKTGVDERSDISNKFEKGEIVFKNPVINTYVNGIFRVMGAADRPFYYRQLANSFYDIAKADGLTKGLKGDALKAHVDDFIKNADNETFNTAMNTATEEAQKAVLSNDTFLSKLASKMSKAADEVDNPLGRQILKTAVNVAIPFSKVPSAFISRVFDFTPYGALRTAVGQIATGKFDQRAMATALSEATTGTAVIWLGSELAKNNLLSGNYPDSATEQARWKIEGIQPNSVKIGNNWVSLNYFGPVGALFNMGKRVSDAQKDGQSIGDTAISLTAGTVQDALGQSFLQGVSGILDAVNDPKRYATSFVNSEISSLVPTIVNDVATATDTVQRQTNNVVDAVKNRIPGLRETSIPSVDSLGNTVTARTDPGSAIGNPFRPSTAHETELTNEIDRLHNVDPNNTDYQVTPSSIDKTLQAAGSTTKLTPQQRTDLQIAAGQSATVAMTGVMNSDAYKAASDDQKAAMLKNASSDAISVAKDNFEQTNKLGQYADGYSGKTSKLTAAQQQIADGNVDGYVTSVANKQSGLDDTTATLDDLSKAYYTKTNGMTTQDLNKYLASAPDDNAKAVATAVNKELPNGLTVAPSNEVAQLYAQYQKAKASGNWSKIEQQEKSDTFHASVVQANKPQLTRDLYSAGSSDAQFYLDQGYVTKSDLDDAVDLDNQLYSAGLESSLKFSKKFRGSYGYGVPAAPTNKTSKSASASGSGGTKSGVSSIKLNFNPASGKKPGDVSTKISAPTSKFRFSAPGGKTSKAQAIKINL